MSDSRPAAAWRYHALAVDRRRPVADAVTRPFDHVCDKAAPEGIRDARMMSDSWREGCRARIRGRLPTGGMPSTQEPELEGRLAR